MKVSNKRVIRCCKSKNERTDNTINTMYVWSKKKDKGQTMIHKTVHRELKIEHHESNAGFRQREALGYSTSEALPNPPPSQLEEDGRVF